jgi:hypothetical protein
LTTGIVTATPKPASRSASCFEMACVAGIVNASNNFPLVVLPSYMTTVSNAAPGLSSAGQNGGIAKASR